jgi:mRNA degradation ribonuclease J1/J2
MGIAIETPYGNVIFTGDLKLEHENGEPVDHEKEKWGALGREKNLIFIAIRRTRRRTASQFPRAA